MNQPLVIDIYHQDPVVDFQAVVDFGILGVIHKAWEKGEPDPLYHIRRDAFAKVGMKKWGCYCFFHGRDKGGLPTAEAKAFLDYAQPDADTLVALDWETDEDGYVPRVDEAKTFLSYIQDRLGRKAVIYTGNVGKEQINGKDAFFGSHRLWLCEYGPAWRVQQSWDRPWLWQNNGDNLGPGPHQIPGIKGNCDNNCLVDPMTADDLMAQWAGSSEAPPNNVGAFGAIANNSSR
jgi:GH25 family lysozyme M1 (1,4-beta-N-acetylmuramidase)